MKSLNQKMEELEPKPDESSSEEFFESPPKEKLSPGMGGGFGICCRDNKARRLDMNGEVALVWWFGCKSNLFGALKLGGGGEMTAPFETPYPISNISQSNSESYVDFVAKLQDNLRKTIPQADPRDCLLNSLTFDKASSECQRVIIICPLGAAGESSGDYARTCRDVGSATSCCPQPERKINKMF